jgi:hypothetical protein
MAKHFHGRPLATEMRPTYQQLPTGRRARRDSRVREPRVCRCAGLHFRLERLARDAELRRRSQGPEIRPLDAATAASISSFSPSASVVTGRGMRADGWDGSPWSHDGSIANVSPSHNATARSITFCNGREKDDLQRVLPECATVGVPRQLLYPTARFLPITS